MTDKYNNLKFTCQIAESLVIKSLKPNLNTQNNNSPLEIVF